MASRAFSADFPGCGAPYSCPFRLSFHSQQLSSPGSALQIPLSSTKPCPPQLATHNSGWNAQSCGVDHLCSSYLVLPSADCLLYSPLIPQKSFSVAANFPTVREFFWVRGPPLTFSFPPGLLVPFLIPLFFFSSFFPPTGYEGIFLVLLGIRSLPLMFSRCSMTIVPFVDVFLMYLWGETNSVSFYSAILTPPPHFVLYNFLLENPPRELTV